MEQKLLGVKINYVRIYQAVEIIENWLKSRGRHYIVTPNPEMLIDAGFDKSFKSALNNAELAVPDSSRLGWGSYIKGVKNPFLRLIYCPSFLFPHLLPRFSYPSTAGTDLMESLLRLSQEKAFTTAFLGGSPEVADRLFKCLKVKYPKLKIVFCSGNVRVNEDGDMQFDTENNRITVSKQIKSNSNLVVGNLDTVKSSSKRHLLDSRVRGNDNSFNIHALSEKIDILFVAFGHKKQEKWMEKNLAKLNTRVMVGVGGAFDYLSGSVPRAPLLMRNLGLEWLFRISVQPWRIKRFWKLFFFVYKVMTAQ